MKFMRKRITASENIAFMGVSAGVVVVVSLLSTFLPLSSLFVVLFLPLICALTTYFCEDKYLPFYILGSIGVSLICTAFNLTSTIFDVIPAVIIGSLFGFFLKKNIPYSNSILILALLKVGLNYLMLLLLKGIYGIDFIETIIKLFGLGEKEIVYQLVPALMFAYALIQIAISFFIIAIAAADFVSIPNNTKLDIISSLLSLILLSLSFGLGFISIPSAYFLGGIGIYLSLAGSQAIFKKNPWWIYLILAFLIIVSFYLSAFFYSKIDKNISPLLFLSFFVSLSLCSCISSLLFKEPKGGKA